MRKFIRGSMTLTLAVMTFGCASRGDPKAAAPSTPQSIAAEGTRACVLQSGGRDVLRLTVPTAASSTPKDGSLHLKSRDGEIDIWLVPGARTVDEATRRADQVIKSEFKDFKATSTTTLTIAGSPAARLKGSGTEADDGDPGESDVIVFQAGDHIFLACTHGESLSAAAQRWLLTVVQTAHAM